MPNNLLNVFFFSSTGFEGSVATTGGIGAIGFMGYTGFWGGTGWFGVLLVPKKLVKSVFGGGIWLLTTGCLFCPWFTFTGETGTGTGWMPGLFWLVPKKLAKSSTFAVGCGGVGCLPGAWKFPRLGFVGDISFRAVLDGWLSFDSPTGCLAGGWGCWGGGCGACFDGCEGGGWGWFDGFF